MTTFIRISLLLLLASLSSSMGAVITIPPRPGIAYAGAAGSPLYRIDLATGALLGRIDREVDPNANVRTSFAIDPITGTLWADDNAWMPSIRRLDSATGRFETVVTAFYNQIAFDPSGTLYTQIVGDSVGAVGPLAILNPATGITQVVSPDLPRIFGLTHNPADGLIYGVTTTREVIAVDPASRSVRSRLFLSDRNGVAGALIIYPDGHAVISDGIAPAPVLRDFDLATGELSNSRFVEGGFWPQALVLIPEPGVLSVTLAGLTLLGMKRRRP